MKDLTACLTTLAYFKNLCYGILWKFSKKKIKAVLHFQKCIGFFFFDKIVLVQ